jgi:hypothetical protein
MIRPTALACLAVLAACGGSPKPTAQLHEAEKNIERARAVGAQDTPQAALHLKMASDLVQEAKQQISEGKLDNEIAMQNLRRASADAELAEALTREQKASDEAATVQERLQKLRQGAAD